MKTLYSSTFLSAIFGFLILLTQADKPVVLVESEEKHIFSTIFKQEGKNLLPTDKVYVDVFNGFNCPSCNVFGQGNLKELKKRYGDDPKIDLKLHLVGSKENPDQLLAMKTIYCGAKNEKYWEMTEGIYELEAVNEANIKTMLEALEWANEEFNTCLAGEEIMTQIEEDQLKIEAEKIKVIPSVLVNDTLLTGNQPLENIEREVRRGLKSLEIKN